MPKARRQCAVGKYENVYAAVLPSIFFWQHSCWDFKYFMIKFNYEVGQRFVAANLMFTIYT